jgi:hypothetical protein
MVDKAESQKQHRCQVEGPSQKWAVLSATESRQDNASFVHFKLSCLPLVSAVVKRQKWGLQSSTLSTTEQLTEMGVERTPELKCQCMYEFGHVCEPRKNTHLSVEHVARALKKILHLYYIFIGFLKRILLLG